MNPNPNPHVSLDFVRMAITVLIAFCRNVVSLLTGNPNYTATPFPALADVTTAIDKLEAANESALGRSRMAVALRKVARIELIGLMRQLAAWVQAHCQNDRVILLSSGFNATKAPAPIGPLATPEAPKVRHGAVTGALRARVGKIAGAYAYNWRLALASAPTVFVQTAQTTSGRYTFDDLTPGQVYVVQASALGTQGPTNWSEPTSLMVI